MKGAKTKRTGQEIECRFRFCMLATYSSYGACWTEFGAVCWQPTALMGHVGRSLGLYVGNLQLLWGMLDGAWGCMLATYSSYGACWTELGAVCWQPTGMLDGAWGCMLAATYRSYGACWTELGAVCWQPTALMGHVGRSLGLYVGNLQVLWGMLDRALGLYVGNLQLLWGMLDGAWLYVGNLQLLWGMLDGVWGCMLATYSSYGACWTEFGAVCWQPTALMGHVGRSLGLYVGNLQLLWGMLDGVWGCMLATYSSYGACWTEFWGCMLATYSSYGACWTEFGAVCWQPTALMGHVERSLRLYVGNLQLLWGMLDWAWGCMLATYKSYGACWTEFGAVCWQPTALMGHVGQSLGLYVGACWTEFGAVCWQPTALMGHVGRSFGAVCWQPTALMGHVGRSLGLYVGNLQVFWGMLDRAWGCMLATYSSYGACWTELGAVCW